MDAFVAVEGWSVLTMVEVLDALPRTTGLARLIQDETCEAISLRRHYPGQVLGVAVRS